MTIVDTDVHTHVKVNSSWHSSPQDFRQDQGRTNIETPRQSTDVFSMDTFNLF